MEGDLVFTKCEALKGGDTNPGCRGVSAWDLPRASKEAAASVHVVTPAEAADGAYTLADVCVPMVGTGVAVPRWAEPLLLEGIAADAEHHPQESVLLAGTEQAAAALAGGRPSGGSGGSGGGGSGGLCREGEGRFDGLSHLQTLDVALRSGHRTRPELTLKGSYRHLIVTPRNVRVLEEEEEEAAGVLEGLHNEAGPTEESTAANGAAACQNIAVGSKGATNEETQNPSGEFASSGLSAARAPERVTRVHFDLPPAAYATVFMRSLLETTGDRNHPA